jgi:hypothetical protein
MERRSSVRRQGSRNASQAPVGSRSLAAWALLFLPLFTRVHGRGILGRWDEKADPSGVSKYENAAGSLPCSYRRRRHRAVGIRESVESAEDAFAKWHGCACVDAQLHTPGGAHVPRTAIYERCRAAGAGEGLGHRTIRACCTVARDARRTRATLASSDCGSSACTSGHGRKRGRSGSCTCRGQAY